MHICGTALLAVSLFFGEAAASDNYLDPPIDCRSCAKWNEPQAPFRIFGNTYYVGTAGLAVILIDTGGGLILLDGALPQSVPKVASNIEKLGFSIDDVRLVALSHAHYDHAGGLAALQRLSGARVIAIRHAANTLARGDILLSPHPFLFQMHEKLEHGGDAFIDRGDCEKYAASPMEKLQRRLARETETD